MPRAGESPFDHFIYVIAGDGDLQEGVTSEASCLAGHQQLGNLIAIYDSNQISIEDDTNVAFTEDVAKRYEAYGWHVQTVDWKKTGEYVEDVAELHAAIEAAQGETDKPSLIILKTIIGWPSPGKQNTGKIHGSALGADELAATKKVLGFDPEQSFVVADDVIAHTRALVERGAADARGLAEVLRRMGGGATPIARRSWTASSPASCPMTSKTRFPSFEAGKEVSTRAASGHGHQRARREASRTLGRFGRSRRIEPHHHQERQELHPRRVVHRTSGPATRMAGCSISASASTRWARSSTGSSCTARPAPSAGPS